MQNCDKAGIILKVRKYISKALTPAPLELKASPQSTFSAIAGSIFFVIGIIKARKIDRAYIVLLIGVVKHG